MLAAATVAGRMCGKESGVKARNGRFVLDRSKRIELTILAGALLGLVGMIGLHRAGVPLITYYLYVLLSAAIGGVLYAALRSVDQPLRRRILLLLLGTSLFGAAALRDPIRANFQIEGLFFDLFSGILFAAVIHYLIAKILGPLLFGRIWCGWACWTAAPLDQLPY